MDNENKDNKEVDALQELPLDTNDVQTTNENTNLETENDTTTKCPEVVSKSVEAETVQMLNIIKELALARKSHESLIQNKANMVFVLVGLENNSTEIVNLCLEILQLLAQYPENRKGLSNVGCIFESLQTAIDKPGQDKVLSYKARAIALLLKQKGLAIKPEKKTRRKPLGDKNPCATTKADRRKNSKNVYLRIADVCIEANRNEITETLRQIQGIISITFVVQKSVCLILSHVRVESSIYGKAVANLGFECSLVAWDSNNEEVWIRQYPDKLENSKNVTGKENEPEYLPDSDDEKDITIGDQAIVPIGEESKQKGGGWLSSAANFLQKSLLW